MSKLTDTLKQISEEKKEISDKIEKVEVLSKAGEEGLSEEFETLKKAFDEANEKLNELVKNAIKSKLGKEDENDLGEITLERLIELYKEESENSTDEQK